MKYRTSKLYIILFLFPTLLFFSCNEKSLKKQNESLISENLKQYGKFLELQDNLKASRDSISLLKKQLEQYAKPLERLYAFAAISYTYTIVQNQKIILVLVI